MRSEFRRTFVGPFERELDQRLLGDHGYDIEQPVDGCMCVICEGLRMYRKNRRNHPGIQRGQRVSVTRLLVFGLNLGMSLLSKKRSRS